MSTTPASQTHPTADQILQTGFAFWGSKVLLTAVTFDLFTKLGDRHLKASELGAELGLHQRAWYDFFDSLFFDRYC